MSLKRPGVEHIDLAWTSISRAYQRKGMVPQAEEAGSKAHILGWKQQLREQKTKTEET